MVMAALRGKLSSRVSLSLYGSAYLQKRVSLGLHPVSLRKSKEMGWNGQQGGGASAQENGAHVTAQDKAASSLHFLRVRRYVGRWSMPVLPFDPISLVLAQRNGVEPPKKSAFLPRRLHHSRERFCLGGRDSSSPDLGRGLVVI